MDDQVFTAEKQENVDSAVQLQLLISSTVEKVERILQQHFQGFLKYDNASFAITRGSTQVAIIIRHFLKEETIIECISNVVSGAKISAELMYFLLRKNAQLHFGSFSVLFDGTITFSHNITGSNLDANELITSLSSVAYISDYYDDIIVDMAGGKRARDVVEEIKT